MPVVKTCPIRQSLNCRQDCAWLVEGNCAVMFIAVAQFAHAFGPDVPMKVVRNG